MDDNDLNDQTLPPHLELLFASLRHSDGVWCILDLAHTYTSISRVLQLRIPNIVSGSCPSLDLFCKFSPNLANALYRDILRVTRDPSPQVSLSSQTSSEETAEFRVVSYARDCTVLCHRALELLADIFSLPPLLHKLHSNQVDTLLAALMQLVSSPSLPGYDATAVRCYGLWILKRTPLKLLLPRFDAIRNALHLCLETPSPKFTAAALQVVSGLLRRSPANWLSHSCSMFRQTLLLSISESMDTRLEALKVVVALAQVKISSPSPLFDAMSERVASLMEKKHNRIRALVTHSLQHSGTVTHLADSPLWAAMLLSSFTVLLDSSISSKSLCLKYSIQLTGKLRHSNSSHVRALLPWVWRCYVWALARLPTNIEGYDSVLHIIQQELSGGVAASIAAVLLSQQYGDSHHPVMRVLSMIQTMLTKESLCIDGVALFMRLLQSSNDASPTSFDRNDILQSDLFGLLDASWDSFLQRSINQPHTTEFLRPLSETEICQNYQVILDTWTLITSLYLNDAAKIDSRDLVWIWQSILLANSHLTQGNGHLTSTSQFSSSVVTVVRNLAASSGNISKQSRQLSLVHELWKVMKNVFSTESWLCSPAQSILEKVSSEHWDLTDDLVEIWTDICADLAHSHPDGFQGLLALLIKQSVGSCAKRSLWNEVADRSRHSNAWEQLAALLSLAFCDWGLSDTELRLAEVLIDRAMQVCDGAPVSVIEYIMNHLEDSKHEGLKKFPRELLLIFSRLMLGQKEERTLHTILKLVSSTLCDLYPPQTPGSTHIVLDFIRHIDGLVIGLPPSSVLALLVSLQDGLYPWLADTTCVDSSDHETTVMKLYKDSLMALIGHSPSAVLDALECFLTTPLHNTRKPGSAIDAFQEFWSSFYDGQDPPDLPVYMKQVLWAYNIVFGPVDDPLPELAPSMASVSPQSSSHSSRTSNALFEKFMACPVLPQTVDRSRFFSNPAFAEMPDSQPGTADLAQPPGVFQDLSFQINSGEEQPFALDSPFSFRPQRMPEQCSTNSERSRVSDAKGKRPLTGDESDATPTKRHKSAQLDSFGPETPTGKTVPRRRLVFDGVHIPPSKRSRHASRTHQRESQLMTPEPSQHGGGHLKEEDYNSFGREHSHQDLGSANRAEDIVQEDLDDECPDKDFLSSHPGRLTGPGLVGSPHTGDDTQEIAEGPPPQRTGSTHLEMLELAYEGLVDDSQIPVPDLLAASHLINKIGGVVTEQLTGRLQGE